MTCMDHYEFEPPMYERFIDKTKGVCTNGMLEKRLIHLY